MRPERWRRIEELCHAALERDATLRGTFLHEVCAGDEELQREVESLLAEEQQVGSFLEASPLEEIAAQEAQAAILFGSELAQSSLVGQQLGSYQVRAKIGEGGMGQVYRAFDAKLRRDVALKVLPRPFASDPERLARFRREAQLLPRSTTRTSPRFMGSRNFPKRTSWYSNWWKARPSPSFY